MTFTPQDHPILGALLGDPDFAAFFAFEADLTAMLAFEGALAEAEADLGLIPPEAAVAIVAACGNFVPDCAALARGAARDGVVAPNLVAQLRAAVGPPHGQHVHKGATSQDVIDTSLTLRLKGYCELLDTQLASLTAILLELSAKYGTAPLMGRTRMQRALPIHAANKLRAWREPLERHKARLDELRPRLLRIQFGGAVGARDGLDGMGDAVAAALARRLGLVDAPCWHVERDAIGEFASLLSLICGTLGKIGQDIALMAQNEVADVSLAGGGLSSAMPHKSNPVAAEVLVAIARYAAGTAGALHQGLVAENERSGASWTLEWLTLPPLAVSTGAALRHASTLCRGLRFRQPDDRAPG